MTPADRITYLAGLVPQICAKHGWDIEAVSCLRFDRPNRKASDVTLHLDAGEPGELDCRIVKPRGAPPYCVAKGTIMDVGFAAFLPLPAEVTA